MMERKMNLWRSFKTIFVPLPMCLSIGCSMFPSEEETLAPPLEVPEEITYKIFEAKTGYIEEGIKEKAIFIAYDESELFLKTTAEDPGKYM
ncbi:MAG TPA: hypothetical protein PK604_11770 [Acetivibrio clariflavus]|nr:hypothetical protein [Acetivibrio clariflavus]HPU42138.1 hypothetical protein [Acetivibrio clariflavus]